MFSERKRSWNSAVDAAGGVKPVRRFTSEPSASWGCCVGEKTLRLRRGFSHSHADRGLEGSWLCSWAVLIAEVDEKRRIQHAPSAFGQEEG
jgi:hypothetical protein